MKMEKIDTREAWLNRFIEAAKPQFADAGYPIPINVRASIGFPSAGRRGKAIGECWGTVSSKDGHFEIFIRPSLDSSSRIADVLTHELVHAAVGLDEKHGKVFKQVATALGLEGKMTATVAGPKWRAWAEPILKQIGQMPGAALTDMRTIQKKQTTRMIKCECDECGLIFRAARKTLEGRELRCPDADCDGMIMIEGGE